ncbi:hypothetical protein IAE38_002286, partial [Pseudomonas sp. S32]|nr:hypothetical protein [Pseudomonas sp. S32]
LNSLNLKEFCVPLSLEVWRIIRGFERASTVYFNKLKWGMYKPSYDPCISQPLQLSGVQPQHFSQDRIGMFTQ